MKVLKNVFWSVVVLMAVAVLAPRVGADEYGIDKAHSTLGFSVSHLVVSKTTGQFDDYDGVIKFDPNDLAASSIDVTVKVDSINTRVADRDAHLKKPEFFDAAQFPEIKFVSKSIVKAGEQYTVTGDLTMKGVTKEVSFPAAINGPVASPMGGTVIGIDAAFKLNRQDYGVSFNKALDTGGVMVGDDVNVNINVEAHKK